MSRLAQVPTSLWSSPRFRRLMITSAVGHVSVAAVVAFAPSSYSSPQQTPVFVTIAATAPAPAPAPAPPAKPEPAPAATPAPTPPPKQSVEEAVVIPQVPREKPRPKKPDPPKKEPPKPAPPPEKVMSPEELMAQIREEVGTVAPEGPETSESEVGIVDPEMAAYTARVQACIYKTWMGAQRYQRRRDLFAIFDVELAADGTVLGVERTRASGERILDESAERAIRGCSPFPEPPRGATVLPIQMIPGEKR